MTEIVEKFLDRKAVTNSNTRKNYIINIDLYFKKLKGDAPTESQWRRISKQQRTEYLIGLNKFIIEYFNNGRTNEQYEDDLLHEYMEQERQGKPLLSRRTFFTSLKTFMIHQKRELQLLEFWETLKQRTRGAEPQLTDFVLTKDILRQILMNAPLMPKALFTMAAATGRRIDELLAIFPEDVNLKRSPTTIEIKRGYDYKKPGKVKQTTKSKTRTTCFLTSEATELYKMWMGQREHYLQSAVKKTTIKKKNSKRYIIKDINDNRVFPMSYTNAMCIWQRLVQKSGLEQFDEVTKRRTLHIHCLRKFFLSYLGDYELADYLAGHSTSLTRAYDRMTLEDRAAKYKSLVKNVTIFSDTVDQEMSELIQQKEKQIKELQCQFEEFKSQITKKQSELDEIIDQRIQQILERQNNDEDAQIEPVQDILHEEFETD